MSHTENPRIRRGWVAFMPTNLDLVDKFPDRRDLDDYRRWLIGYVYYPTHMRRVKGRVRAVSLYWKVLNDLLPARDRKRIVDEMVDEEVFKCVGAPSPASGPDAFAWRNPIETVGTRWCPSGTGSCFGRWPATGNRSGMTSATNLPRFGCGWSGSRSL